MQLQNNYWCMNIAPWAPVCSPLCSNSTWILYSLSSSPSTWHLTADEYCSGSCTAGQLKGGKPVLKHLACHSVHAVTLSQHYVVLIIIFLSLCPAILRIHTNDATITTSTTQWLAECESKLHLIVVPCEPHTIRVEVVSIGDSIL